MPFGEAELAVIRRALAVAAMTALITLITNDLTSFQLIAPSAAVLEHAPRGTIATVPPYPRHGQDWFFGEDFRTSLRRDRVATSVFGLRGITLVPGSGGGWVLDDGGQRAVVIASYKELWGARHLRDGSTHSRLEAVAIHISRHPDPLKNAGTRRPTRRRRGDAHRRAAPPDAHRAVSTVACRGRYPHLYDRRCA
jgi:hypothetical protein